MVIALSIIISIAAVVIVGLVLMQSGKSRKLSGAIAGGAETYFGKNRASGTDRALYKWTLIAAIVFAVAVLVVFIIQPDYSSSFTLEDWKNEYLNNYSYIFPTK